MRKVLIFSLLLLLILSCSTKKIKVEPQLFNYTKSDQGLIDLLVTQGSNTNKEHWVSFMVDCKTEDQLSEIISKAKLVGFEDDYISYSEENKLWSSPLSVSIKLNLGEITKYRTLLMPLIPDEVCNGVGWGAGVVK